MAGVILVSSDWALTCVLSFLTWGKSLRQVVLFRNCRIWCVVSAAQIVSCTTPDRPSAEQGKRFVRLPALIIFAGAHTYMTPIVRLVFPLTQENNTEECGYDEGDCCSCDCSDGGPDIPCGINGFNCVNPDSECFGEFVEICECCFGCQLHPGGGE